jgi:hypothetical protein
MVPIITTGDWAGDAACLSANILDSRAVTDMHMNALGALGADATKDGMDWWVAIDTSAACSTFGWPYLPYAESWYYLHQPAIFDTTSVMGFAPIPYYGSWATDITRLRIAIRGGMLLDVNRPMNVLRAWVTGEPVSVAPIGLPAMMNTAAAASSRSRGFLSVAGPHQ